MKETSAFARLVTTFAVFSLSLSPLAATAQEKGKNLSKADQHFMAEAYQGGLAEVQVGELAKTKATTAEARTLAERLVSDHQKSNEELKQLAESKAITLPTEPKAASQALMKTLEKKEGAAFDKIFAQDAVKDHKKDIGSFQQIAKETKDDDLKKFVEKTIPVLKEHLALAETAERKAQEGKKP